MRTACLSILLALPFAISGPARAEDPADEGPRHRVLVELFTSQG